jgi:hypothetical protein
MNRQKRRMLDAVARQSGAQRATPPERRHGRIVAIKGPIYVTINGGMVNVPAPFRPGDVVPGEPCDVTIVYDRVW